MTLSGVFLQYSDFIVLERIPVRLNLLEHLLYLPFEQPLFRKTPSLVKKRNFRAVQESHAKKTARDTHCLDIEVKTTVEQKIYDARKKERKHINDQFQIALRR